MPAGKKKSQDESLKIADVADRAGVSKQTVEYYVMLGLLHPRREGTSRRRLFDPSHVKRVQLIRQLNETGYTLREIRDIFLKEK